MSASANSRFESAMKASFAERGAGAAFDTFIVVNDGGFQRKCRRTFGERRGREQRAAIQ